MKWILRLTPVLFFIGFAGYTSVFRISKNFHEVEPGLLYRSAQLFPGELKNAINAYGFKTVISLRGSPPVLFNMEDEEIILKEMNVGFYKFDLEEDFFPSRQDLLNLLEVLKNAPRPILIHCRSGADRTGMVAALFEMEEMKKPRAEALKQLIDSCINKAIKNPWAVYHFHEGGSDARKTIGIREEARRAAVAGGARSGSRGCKPEFGGEEIQGRDWYRLPLVREAS